MIFSAGYDLFLYFFFVVTMYICTKEGLKGIFKQRCRTPFAAAPHFEGIGILAVFWGIIYLLVGLLYAYFTLESTIYASSYIIFNVMGVLFKSS